jgi:hypothetical protein
VTCSVAYFAASGINFQFCRPWKIINTEGKLHVCCGLHCERGQAPHKGRKEEKQRKRVKIKRKNENGTRNINFQVDCLTILMRSTGL